MKATILIILCVICSALTAVSQSDTLFPKTYRTWVTRINYRTSVNGILHEVKDSSLAVTLSATPGVKPTGAYEIRDVDIDKILLRRKGAQGMGVGIGLGVGIALGCLVGFMIEAPGVDKEADKQFNTMKMILFPLLGAGIGAGVGGMIGGAKIKIPIYGSRDEFSRRKEELKRYAIIKGN